MSAGAHDAEGAVLRLAGEVTIYQAAQLKQDLLAALDGAAPGSVLALDLGQVTELDTAGLQVLLLARETARTRRQALRLDAPSAAVVEVLDLVGLAGLCAPVSAMRERGHGA